jgi:hypothetical protein
VVDILDRAFMGVKDMNNSQEVTNALSPIQTLSQKLDIGILILDQHGKSRGFSPNPINDLMASTAKAAVTDVAMGLYHDENSKTFSLAAIGRDLDGEIKMDIKRDLLTHTWQLAYDPDKPQNSQRKLQIIEFLERGVKVKLMELLHFLELPDSRKGSLYHDLQAMVLSGQVKYDEISHTYYV